MRPLLEKVMPLPGESWALLNRRLDAEIPFQWHHHPEFELTLTLNSFGQRFIGDHIGEYGDGDLVLVGPNLPHTWASRGKCDPGGPHVALVIWFHPDWTAALGGVFKEFGDIARLLGRAGRGLHFSDATARLARPMVERLFREPPSRRLLTLLEVLLCLSTDSAAAPLASPVPMARGVAADRTRIDRVLNFLHTHYDGEIAIPELSDVAALSPSGLERLFRRHTGTTISAYVMRLRIGQACALLSAGDRPIAHIAGAAGYASLANFNRQFKALKAMTPRAYRRHFRGL